LVKLKACDASNRCGIMAKWTDAEAASEQVSKKMLLQHLQETAGAGMPGRRPNLACRSGV